jgi:ABC-type phosphate transport system auxiliary subunit
MTEISRVTAQNAEVYRQTQVKKVDRRHEELRLEERRVQADAKVDEQARIEMNRRMNRAGQNVDRMA